MTRVDIREVIQCLTDSNALLEDTAHKTRPDKHAEYRKRICDAAREEYALGDTPYEPGTCSQSLAGKTAEAWLQDYFRGEYQGFHVISLANLLEK